MLRLNSFIIAVVTIFITSFLIFKDANNVYKSDIEDAIGALGTIESIGYDKINAKGETVLIVLDTNTSKEYSNVSVINENDRASSSTHADKLIQLANEIYPEVQIQVYVVADEDGLVDNDKFYTVLQNLKITGSSAVINMSFKTVEEPRLNDEIDFLSNQNVILIAAAGNDNKSKVAYPASNNKVISVGAINRMGYIDDNSNYEELDYVMPGTYITSDDCIIEGTSVSSMLLSLAVVAVWNNSAKKGNEEISECIKKNSVNPWKSNLYGNGQLVIN